jgi:hypothetical protein
MRTALNLLQACVLATLAPPAAAQLEQIQRSAAFFRDSMREQTGNPAFGCDRASIAHLDGFLTRQREVVKRDERTIQRFTSMIGSFIGECLLQTYQGSWNISPNYIQLTINAGGMIHILRPFHKVSERIEQDLDGELVNYLFVTIPSAVAQLGSESKVQQ